MAQHDSRTTSTGHVKLIERKSGPKFYAKFRPADGEQTTRLIGPAWLKRGRAPEGFFTRQMAEVELRRIMDAAGDYSLGNNAATFSAACDEWLRYLEHEKRVAPTTLRHNRSAVHARLAPFFGADTPLAAITTERIDAYRAHALTERALAPSTVQRDLTNLSGIFRRAVRMRWIQASPYDHAERVRVVQSGDFNVLAVEQVEAVARRAACEQDAAMYRVAAYTGLRLGELRALRWRHVDFAGATVHVRRNLPAHGQEKAPKSGEVRSVPLIDQAARALDALTRREFLTDPDDYVFPSPTGAALDDGDIRDGFYTALDAAGLGHMRELEEPIVFHDLRHTFGTLAVQVWPVTDVQAYMGHADIKTTMRYVHHVPKHDAAERFSRFVEGQLGVSPLCPEPTSSDTTERNSARLIAA
jgi:integrase